MKAKHHSQDASLPAQLPSRVVIENVRPEIDGGRFPIKRAVGDEVEVTTDIHGDGHDLLAAVLCYRHADQAGWQEVPLEELGKDSWRGRFLVSELGCYEYTVRAWIDRFGSWRAELEKKFEAGQDVTSELLEGAQMVSQAGQSAMGADADGLRQRAKLLGGSGEVSERVSVALDPELVAVMGRHEESSRLASYDKMLRVTVDRELARCGAWYEMFPRSCSRKPGRHGTFRDAEARLPEIAQMGFDVLYLPPIHPIGRSFRKGPNDTLAAGPDDPGSPWGIGSSEGGHKSVHPQLGTLEDFDRFVAVANRLGLEISIDVAFHCSPDHPYVQERPEWFRHRPDGSIKYAENPPKKYQDIYPLDFKCDDWRGLWQELKDVLLFWIGHGVHIFRVDNPHTKPYHFWEWLIGEIKREHPETIFLAEAFTRPTVMRQLAKVGFTQSYTYFAWRNTKAELTEHLTELTKEESSEYLRPNLFTNTPDILHEYLQFGGRPAFQARLVLAATLGASYGIYGPAFELCEAQAVPGSEDYQGSEKYQLRHWDYDRPGNIRDLITRVNQIRRENPALHFNRNLRFYPIDNEQMIFYGKATPDLSNIILVVVNLDPHHRQSGWVQVPLAELGLGESGPYQVHDLISEARYLWHGENNFVQLDPQICPAHIFRVHRRIRTEKDFDYFM